MNSQATCTNRSFLCSHTLVAINSVKKNGYTGNESKSFRVIVLDSESGQTNKRKKTSKSQNTLQLIFEDTFFPGEKTRLQNLVIMLGRSFVRLAAAASSSSSCNVKPASTNISKHRIQTEHNETEK